MRRLQFLFTVLLFSISTTSLFAQQMMEFKGAKPEVGNYFTQFTPRQSTDCGVDTVQYPNGKTSIATRFLSINNASSGQAICQYYDVPEPLIVHGFDVFVTNATDPGGPSIVTCTVEMYTAGPDSMPSGTPLATTTVGIDSSASFSLVDMRRKIVFTNPVAVTEPFVLVFKNASPDNVTMVFNDWTLNDGASEWLSSGEFPTTGWTRSYDMNVGAVPLDADALLHPYVEYQIEALFSADKTCLGATLPSMVTLTNFSSPIVNNRMYNTAFLSGNPSGSYRWDYGDASPLFFGMNTTHNYGAGPYNCSLTLAMGSWNGVCNSDTTVVIGSNASAHAAWQHSITGFTSNFQDVSSGPATWDWDFGDGNTSSAQNPAHKYAANGTYYVQLIVDNTCGGDTAGDSITINCVEPPVTASFTASNSYFQATFISSTTNATNWSWNFGDGTGTSSAENPTYSYANSGYYTVTLIAYNLCYADTFVDSVFAGLVGNEDPLFSRLNIYPNPASTTLRIEGLEAQNSSLELNVIDLQGKQVLYLRKEKTTRNITLDINDLQPGIYFLEIQLNGQKTTRKVIKI